MSTTTRETTITADPAAPTVAITREFDAPPEKVFRDPAVMESYTGTAHA